MRIPIIGVSGGDGTVGADLRLGEQIGRSIARRRLDCILLSGGEPTIRPRIQDAPLHGLVDEAAKLAVGATFIALPRHSGAAVARAPDTRYMPPVRGVIFRDQNAYSNGADSSRRNMLVAAVPDVLLIFKGGQGGGTLSEAAFAMSLGRPVIFVNSFKELARLIGALPAATETITKTTTDTETETQTAVAGGQLIQTESQVGAGGVVETQSEALLGAGTQTETQSQTTTETITKTVAACKQHIGEHYDGPQADAVFAGLTSVLSAHKDYARSTSLNMPLDLIDADLSPVADLIVDLALRMVALYGMSGEYPAGLTKSGLDIHKPAFDNAVSSITPP